MAGSYHHMINDKGQYIGVALLDNLGDCYEALEECYGMIWYLANGDAKKVADAEQNHKSGLHMSPGLSELEDE